jgi:hypothetical protein
VHSGDFSPCILPSCPYRPFFGCGCRILVKIRLGQAGVALEDRVAPSSRAAVAERFLAQQVRRSLPAADLAGFAD